MTPVSTLFLGNKTAFKRLIKLAIICYFMNLASDIVGCWLTRSWFYPFFDPVWYIFLATPFGYVLFGLVLYLSYKVFKRLFSSNKKIKLKKVGKIYPTVVITGAFLSLIGGYLGINYLYNSVSRLGVPWYAININSHIPVQIEYFIISALSAFFFIEFLCYILKRSTLTLNLLSGNFRPLLAILLATITGIIMIEIVNAPFQIWSFANWPMQAHSIATLPTLVYMLWPLQFLFTTSIDQTIRPQ